MTGNTITLTPKENTLIKDLKDQEKLCEQKYKKHAECAHDPQLKQLFGELANVEKHHYDMLVQMESGTVPSVEGKAQAPSSTFTTTYKGGETPEKSQDAYLCSDLLSTEKHVSGLYNTCVFEFAQPACREVLNHIQSEEQWHGERIYAYMKANNMYS